jgi:DNA-binding response OmpR family regulator
MKPLISPKSKIVHAQSANRRRDPVPFSEPASQPSTESSQRGSRILLVDDDPTVRDSLKEVLVAEGYFVVPAENGQRALDLANQSALDLALLDLNMPVKNGWDTFEQLTREHPVLPTIIITARPNQVFTALSAGAGALLEKPMDIPTLLRTMKTLLAEPTERRLARLAGKQVGFHYQPAAAIREREPLDKASLKPAQVHDKRSR